MIETEIYAQLSKYILEWDRPVMVTNPAQHNSTRPTFHIEIMYTFETIICLV